MDTADLQSFARCHAVNSGIDQIDCYETSLNELFRDDEKCLVSSVGQCTILVYSYSRRCVLINANAINLSLSIRETYEEEKKIIHALGPTNFFLLDEWDRFNVKRKMLDVKKFCN